MSDWIKAINPTAPITTEAEATRASKASAISIFIGVIVGIIGVAWLFMNPAIMQNAMAQAGAQNPDAAAVAGVATQIALWTSCAVVVIQMILGFVQWRSPNKIIAIIFILLVIYGLLSNLLAPMLAGSMPNMPVIPLWQTVLSIVVLIVQLVLHFAGLRGIGKLDKIQMEGAR